MANVQIPKSLVNPVTRVSKGSQRRCGLKYEGYKADPSEAQ